MSAASGISASQELLDEYSRVTSDPTIRFLKVAIQNESLVPVGTWPREGSSVRNDLAKLGEILEQNSPAYIIARLDSGANDWLFISYVPDNAKIREKMLYASSRNALTRALGGQTFKDTIFATSKYDVTPEGYDAHLHHQAGPQPLSAREAELAELQAAARQSSTAFEGARARKNHVGSGVGLSWGPGVEDALRELVAGTGVNLIVLSIDASETIQVSNTTTAALNTLSTSLPTSEPSYAFFRWQDQKIIFVYTCPSASKIKQRMIYSSGVSTLINNAQTTLGFKVYKKLEASDPSDLDVSVAEETPESSRPSSAAPPAFARPRGPPRKR